MKMVDMEESFELKAPAVVFPGQRDLGSAYRVAYDLLERCVALVGEDPFPRAGESTRFAQPAIFCASLARWDALSLDAAPSVAEASRWVAGTAIRH